MCNICVHCLKIVPIILKGCTFTLEFSCKQKAASTYLRALESGSKEV